MPHANPTLCFDLDGTLVNTAPDLLNALDYSLTQNGHPKSNHTQIRTIIGQGAMAMLKQAITSSAQPLSPPNDQDLKPLWQTMIDHYATHIADESHLFDGAKTILDELKQAGHPLTICTNKPEFLTKPLLETLKITPLFHTITCSDTYAFKKPDPRTLIETITAAGGTPENAIMIGDSKTDIDTARNANIPVIGTTFGYTDTPMQTLQPDKLMTHYSELPSLIASLI